jgi:hypothetical protein
MTLSEIKDAIASKTIEFDAALQEGRPREQCFLLYKELKDLRYKLVELELTNKKQYLELA